MVTAILTEKLGDLGQWHFTGQVIYNDEHDGLEELPRCVCGHPIRYSHEIKNHNGSEFAYVGSECISHFRRPFGVRRAAELRRYAKWDAGF